MNRFATKNQVNPFEEIQNSQNEILSALKEIKSVLKIDGKAYNNSPDKQYYSIKDLSNITGMTVQEIYKHVHLNRIKSFKAGRKRYFLKEDIDAFMQGSHTPESILK